MSASLTAGDRLLFAIHRSDLADVRAALAAGAGIDDADADDWTPLMHAIRFADAPTVKALLAAGARPEIQDGNGWTAFAHATDGGDPQIIAMLAEKAVA